MSKRFLAALLALLLAFAHISPAEARGFTDTQGHWAQNTIDWAGQKKLLKGYPDGSFKPNKAITRAEFLALLNRDTKSVKSMSTAGVSLKFSDVKNDDWYAGEVKKAIKAGYLKNESGALKGDEKINRAEAVSLFVKAKKMNGKPEDALKFEDCGMMNDLELLAVGAATKAKVINGFPDGTFRPRKTLNRAQVVTILYNYAKHVSGEDVSITPTPDPQPTPDPEPGPGLISPLLPNHVWSFNNSGKNFGFGYQLNPELMEIIEQNLSPADVNAIYNSMTRNWGGSCFGFTASIELINKKLITFNGLNNEKRNTLSEVQPEGEAYRPQNLINFYQLMQYIANYDAKQAEAEAKGRFITWYPDDSLAEYWTSVKKMIDGYKQGGDFVQIGIYWSESGHALLALDYADRGNGLIEIKIYDPNNHYLDASEPKSALFLDTKNNRAYGTKVGTSGDVVSDNELEYDKLEFSNDYSLYNSLNPQRPSPVTSQLSGSMIYNFDQVNLSIEADGQTYEGTTKPDTSSQTGFSTRIVPDGIPIYVLNRKPSQLTVSNASGAAINNGVHFGDKFMSAKASSGKKVVYGKNGEVRLNAPGSTYEVSVTDNATSGSFKNNTVSLKGKDGAAIAITKAKGAYKVSGKNLKGATLSAGKPGKLGAITINTDKDEVFVSSDGNKVVAKVDSNGDGNPDQEIGSTTLSGGGSSGGSGGVG